MRIATLFIALMLFNALLFSQEEKTIHQLQSEFYKNNPHLVGMESIPKKSTNPEFDKPFSISHKVYSFHPYWVSDATASGYYYSLLTHIAYFSAEVDNSVSTTGGFSSTRNWSSTQIVNYCKNNGVKIHLAITMFTNHDRILANSSYTTNLVNNILALVKLRNAHGANIDFESIAVAQKTNYKNFIKQLGDSLKANNLELVVEMPAVDWNGIYDNTFFSTINSVVDYYFLMAYDYYWRGSSTAGPVSPLTTGTSIRHVMRSITAYATAGAASSKLITGFNYFGYEWPVASSSRMASTTGDGVAKTFSQIKTALGSIPPGDIFFDATYNSSWFRFQSGAQWYQTWYDDSLSLSMKYDSIKTKGCAGIGMWALSYDGSNTDLWGALKNSFASLSNSANTMLANFEFSVGIFNNTPTYSGSTVGISTSSTSERIVAQALNGWGALKVVLVDNSSSSSNWTVRLVSGGGSQSNNQTLSSSGYIGFWLKTSSAPSGAQVAITIDDIAGGTELSPKRTIDNNGEWTLYEWNLQEAGWSSFSLGNGVINGPTVTLDAIMFYAANNSSDWTIYIDDVSYNSAGSLPVELISLQAIASNNNVRLIWQTATEVNNYGFEIERTVSGQHSSVGSQSQNMWEKVGFVIGAGNSNSPKEYNFTNKSVTSGKYLYRLKQIDNDGKYQYSKEVGVELGMPTAFVLEQNYPNPFNPQTNINYQLPVASNVTLELNNIIGEKIATLINQYQEAGSYKYLFDATKIIGGLTSGVYFYTMRFTPLNGMAYSKTNKLILTK